MNYKESWKRRRKESENYGLRLKEWVTYTAQKEIEQIKKSDLIALGIGNNLEICLALAEEFYLTDEMIEDLVEKELLSKPSKTYISSEGKQKCKEAFDGFKNEIRLLTLALMKYTLLSDKEFRNKN